VGNEIAICEKIIPSRGKFSAKKLAVIQPAAEPTCGHPEMFLFIYFSINAYTQNLCSFLTFRLKAFKNIFYNLWNIFWNLKKYSLV